MSLLPDPKVARQQSLYPTDGCFTAVMADLDEMLDHESDSGIPQSHRDATPNALEHGRSQNPGVPLYNEPLMADGCLVFTNRGGLRIAFDSDIGPEGTLIGTRLSDRVAPDGESDHVSVGGEYETLSVVDIFVEHPVLPDNAALAIPRDRQHRAPRMEPEAGFVGSSAFGTANHHFLPRILSTTSTEVSSTDNPESERLTLSSNVFLVPSGSGGLHGHNSTTPIVAATMPNRVDEMDTTFPAPAFRDQPGSSSVNHEAPEMETSLPFGDSPREAHASHTNIADVSTSEHVEQHASMEVAVAKLTSANPDHSCSLQRSNTDLGAAQEDPTPVVHISITRTWPGLGSTISHTVHSNQTPRSMMSLDIPAALGQVARSPISLSGSRVTSRPSSNWLGAGTDATLGAVADDFESKEKPVESVVKC